ncbi:ATP-binding cassette domain-containing protein [Thermomonospora umbrina]|uniref:ATP-binding cassette subfamily C protein n=1 Tax=Thermomonospora umbrina TaxID=111806 RepID=A0A3D9SSG1_9ACTN|nr:ATP-binding cassette domain-containing protein [Thermomonospora umbrina]REE98906.1 ATP-binding cassette subfamily C protein [Thermomonospora umbrina]
MNARRQVPRVLVRTLVQTTRRRPRATLRLAAWSLVEVVPTVLFGQAVARSVDAFREGRTGTALAWLGALATAGLAGALGYRRLYAALAAVVEPFRDELVRTVVEGALRRSLAGRPDTGAVARMTHQVEIARDTFAGVLMVVRGFVFSVTGALLGLLSLAPSLLVPVVPPLLLGVALFLAIVPAAAARQREVILGEERIAELTTAMTEGLRDVVACGAENAVGEEAGRAIDAQAAAAHAVARLAGARAATLAVGGWLPVLLILGAAPWLTRNGATAGTIVGAVAYVLHGLQPALNSLVLGLGGSGLRLAVTMTRILEAGPTAGPPPAVTARAGPFVMAEGVEVRFERVTFAYGERAAPVIEGLDLVVSAGDHLAVVGPSGIGKSTLAALIAGLLRPSEGTLSVAGRPPGDPRARVLIPQEAYVFDDTLHANLTYLAPEADDAAVARAVDAIGLSGLARRIGGYGARVDPGALSAGERQLIALTRAYLAAAPLTVLDEATCHLDPAAEARAESAFARRPGTLIVIAHRVSSALRARRVLVLDGTSAHHGGHDELLESSAWYRGLVGDARSQPAGGLGDPDGVHPVAGADLAVDAGQMVADRADGEHQGVGDLSGRGPLPRQL